MFLFKTMQWKQTWKSWEESLHIVYTCTKSCYFCIEITDMYSEVKRQVCTTSLYQSFTVVFQKSGFQLELKMFTFFLQRPAVFIWLFNHNCRAFDNVLDNLMIKTSSSPVLFVATSQCRYSNCRSCWLLRS